MSVRAGPVRTLIDEIFNFSNVKEIIKMIGDEIIQAIEEKDMTKLKFHLMHQRYYKI